MPLVYLLYLLCAISDCPPQPLRTNEGRNFSLRGVIERTVTSMRIPEPVRFTRSGSSFGGSPVTSVVLGELQGKYLKSRGGRKIAAFEGIPYALPPVGSRRFRNPVPVTKPWKGVRIVDKMGKDCLQLDFLRYLQVRGQEDCLYLNVYAPAHHLNQQNPGNTTHHGRLLPVLVLIHGGGWMSTSSAVYGPRYLLDKDIILVTFNFRLGVLGFLSTGDKHARGNFALKDQLTVLKWVVDNISSFGGDPKKMTLMGLSTGAGATSLHLISPLTSKLIPIQGAILSSGSSFNHWSIMNDTIANTKAIARRMNCPTDSSYKLVECLRGKNPYLVAGQQLQIWKIPIISRLLFGPVIESKEDNPDAFLVEAPEVTYSRPGAVKPIPAIAGVTRDEGGTFAAYAYMLPFLFSAFNGNWNEMASYAMGYDNLEGVNVPEVSRKISKFYFDQKPWSFNNREDIGRALGDRTITTGVHKFLQRHSTVAPTYGYVFSHSTPHNLVNSVGLQWSEWGVSHSDDNQFIFSLEQMFGEFTEERDIEMSEFLVGVVANFANDSRPMPPNGINWNPISNPEKMEVLDIARKKKIIQFPFSDRMRFWEGLHLN